jgi:hypothetical protein
MWLPVRTEPTPVHGGRWQRFCVASLSKHRRRNSRIFAHATLGETLDLGLLDRMMATLRTILPHEASFLE